jgi:asparagine synthase (glutamine-hydrolysing)
VIDFAWRLPMEYKLREGQSKWPLRQILYRHVPRELIERPKHGFGVPIGAWLRGPLREWAEDLLDEGALKDQGFFQPEPIRAMWADHLSGGVNREHHLWDVTHVPVVARGSGRRRTGAACRAGSPARLGGCAMTQ